MTPTYHELLRSFGRIGLLSFGGPAAQISLMHEELVTRKGWIDEQSFLGALSFCMLLPGPEAMQLATYTGWKLRGVPGGLLAGLLFVLPGAGVILALGFGYALYGQLDLVQTLFAGIRAAVVVIIARALVKLSRKALHGVQGWALAGLSFVAIYCLNLPFPLIIAAAALWGLAQKAPPSSISVPAPAVRPRTVLTIAIWVTLWLAPIAILAALGHQFLTELALFFSKLAVVTFGGAYAVLTYMAQAVVDDKGWLSTGQMIDALGLAETTPGPLILVTEFVGLLAGYLKGGVALALVSSALTLWVTFVPCFLWIFAGAPYVETLLAKPRLNAALKCVSAAVVGVILNLALVFALHTLFGRVQMTRWGLMPELASFDLQAALLTLCAVILLIPCRIPVAIGLILMSGIALSASAFF